MNWYENPIELVKRRREAGLSQEELGTLCGKSSVWVSQLETGKVKLSGDNAMKVWSVIREHTMAEKSKYGPDFESFCTIVSIN